MCCVLTAIFFIGPRVGLLIWYLFNPVYVNGAFDNFIWGFLGWLLLPWTTLMYIAIYPGGILGFDWIWLGLGVFADIFSYVGGLPRTGAGALRGNDSVKSQAFRCDSASMVETEKFADWPINGWRMAYSAPGGLRHTPYGITC